MAARTGKRNLALSATEKPPLHNEELRINAIAVSRGIGDGLAFFLPAFDIPAEHRSLTDENVSQEVDRLKFAVGRAQVNLDKLASPAAGNDSIAGIFDTHLLILDSFAAKVEHRIRSEHVNSEWAINAILKDGVARQGTDTDKHLLEKHLDLKDVAAGIIDELRNADRVEIPSGSVVISHEIRPSAVMELERTSPAAFVTRRGGWTSHSAILARELGIPMITGANLSMIQPGDRVIADGFSGEVIVRPGEKAIASLSSAQISIAKPVSTSDLGKETTTLNGIGMTLRVNTESPVAYENARRVGATGVGLFRSESLIPKSGRLPDEDQQAVAYTRIGETVGTAGVNIRTFDIGPETSNGMSVAERNPSLGLRSIRLSLAEPELLKTQLRAILRANDLGNLSIVIPLVSGLSEIRRFRDALNQVVESTSASSKRIPRVGAMIEVPSAVLSAREIADEVDFLCLGTNDLVQYLLAVDRDNERVADWYQTLNPGVLRAISEVVAAGSDATIPVTVCGEMAGSLFYIPLLIGLGVRDLSMSGNSIAAARRLIGGISSLDAKAVAIEAAEGKTAAEVDSALRKLYLKHWAHLFPEGFLDLKHS